MGDTIGAGSVLRIVLSLAVLVGGILLLRRWGQRGGLGGRSGLRVVGRASLGRGTGVAIVAVGERHLVVGTSEHGVNLLAELDADEVAHLGEPDDDTIGAPPRGLRASVTGSGQRDRDGSRSGEWITGGDRGPGTGLVAQLRRMTLRTAAGRPRGPGA